MSAYDEIAAWYDTWVGDQAMSEDPYYPTVEALMGNVAGLRVCDVACGQGRVSRHLADRGARVVGVDLSEKLLEIARRYEESQPRGVEYLHANAHTLDGLADASFDGAVCHMALMDIPDLAGTLRSIARILRPGGWFVFAILHPCYHTALSGEMETPDGVVRTIGRYFQEGHWRSESRPGPPGKVGAYHRTLSTYLNTLTDAGFMVERLAEPRAGGELSASPSTAGSGRPVWSEVPAVLAARCVKWRV